MTTYKKLTLEEIESLQEKNETLGQDLESLHKLDKIIEELKEKQYQYSKERETILQKYKSEYSSRYNTDLTRERFVVYSTCDIDEANVRIHTINGKELILAGSYYYGQDKFEIIIPDYENFIAQGYYKGTITIYDNDHPYIVINDYTNEAMKEVIYMYLRDDLQNLINNKKNYDKYIVEYTEKSKKLEAEIQSYHDIPDSKISKIFAKASFFNGKDAFMNSLPRKIDVFELLEEDKETDRD